MSRRASARRRRCRAELCNVRGICARFFPEDGAPPAVKPRPFPDRARCAADGGVAFPVIPAPPCAGPHFTVTIAAVVAARQSRLAVAVDGPGGPPLRPEDLK